MGRKITRRDVDKFLKVYAKRKLGAVRSWNGISDAQEFPVCMRYQKINFDEPVTTVIWADGMKTSARCCTEDKFVPEYGVLLCLLKRLCDGDEDLYHAALKDFTRDYHEKT